jgi:hypothetical protein
MGLDRLSTPASATDARHARWLFLFAVSILLHGVILIWAGGRIGPATPDPVQPPLVTAMLHAAPAPPPARVAPAAPRPAKPRVRPRAAAAAPAETSAAAPDLTAFALPVQEEAVADEGARENAGRDATPTLADVMPAMEESSLVYARPDYPVDPPPSVELHYDVYAMREGNAWYGSGLFRWESDGANYRLSGEASVRILFKVTVLNFTSEGVINSFGIAPVLYSEKPWRKSMTNTHFQHAQQKISFSASTASYPYQGGEQDRASILWQLAGIGRGAPERFFPGAEIGVVVAGTRDASPWHIRVLGQEEIDTALGKLQTWHLVRARRSASYDQRIDVWLAPEQHWYPVKLRHTYANGDYLDLSLATLTAVNPAAPNERED